MTLIRTKYVAPSVVKAGDEASKEKKSKKEKKTKKSKAKSKGENEKKEAKELNGDPSLKNVNVSEIDQNETKVVGE